MKKTLIILCAISLLLNSSAVVNAHVITNTVDTNVITSTQDTQTTDTDTVASTHEPSTSPWPEEAPTVNSEAAIVMEASTGAILYSKNIHDTFYPASITKILTALLAIENSSLGETVTFSKEAIFDVDLDSSRIGIDVGEKLTMEQSLYGIMLESANEVSYGIAEHISGDVKSFTKLMNEKAVELGCTDSNFVNPHGLPDPDHYTSAYDMALISRAAINNKTFREITGSRTYTIPPTNIQEETRYLANHHKLVRNDSSFEGCIGGKTGYTSKAQYTLVTFAERDGVTLISVILHCDSITNEYADTTNLLNYAFDNYSVYSIAEIEEPNTIDSSPLFTKYSSLFSSTNSRLQVSPNGNIVLPKSASYEDAEKEITLSPISSIVEGENVIGSISYTYNGIYVGSADVIYNNKVTPSLLKNSFIPSPTAVADAQTYETTGNQPTSLNNKKSIIIGIIIGVIILGAGLYIVLVELPYRRRRSAYHQKREHKKRSSDKSYLDF